MTTERYMVVFTGFFTDKKPGAYLYLAMSDESFAPGGSTLRRGWPPYERIGREIPFKELPEDCRRLVLDVYRDLWSLLEEPIPRSTDRRRMRRA